MQSQKRQTRSSGLFEVLRLSEYAEQSSRSVVLAVAAKVSLALLPAYVLLSLTQGDEIPALYPLLGVFLAGSAVSLWLVRKSLLRPAALLLVFQAFAVVAYLVLGQGVHSPHVSAFMPVIVASSLLLSARGTILTVLACALALLVAAALDQRWLSESDGPFDPVLFAPIVHMALTGGFIAVLMHSFSQTLGQLRLKQAELKSSQDQLRRAEKMEAIGQLAGGVAHDFNNILTGMLGHIDLMRMRLLEHPAGSSLDRDLAALERSAERAADITRQLLTFSRKEGPEAGLANLSRTLEQADVILRRLIREDVEFRVVSEDTGFVPVSPTGLEQILMNLVLNASDSMPRGGTVTVTTKRVDVARHRAVTTGDLPPGHYICLTVADAGEGIPATRLERVFEPFFTTKAVGKGTGLGLSTVLGIVQRAGGQIDVYSVVGEGTTFHVYLPLSADAAPSEPLITIPPAAGAGALVLVCEDDTTILGVLREVLSGAGYEVLAFSDPEVALERGLAVGRELSLLITDVIMPNLSGPELAQGLQASHPTLPVLFMSGYTGGLLEGLGIDARDPRLLVKPFTPRDLLERVQESRGSGPHSPG
jgi:signal transduction histidine kinase